jgi:hypothetical protein
MLFLLGFERPSGFCKPWAVPIEFERGIKPRQRTSGGLLQLLLQYLRGAGTDLEKLFHTRKDNELGVKVTFAKIAPGFTGI